MITLFVEGGALWMTLLTLELIALFLAAWKAPGWVKETGLIALITGLISTLTGLYNAFAAIEAAGGIPLSLAAGGARVGMITMVYGCIIYGISLIIRIIQKPKLL